MPTKEERYAAIAQQMRTQPLPENPIKHEREELYKRLEGNKQHSLEKLKDVSVEPAYTQESKADSKDAD